MFSSWFHAAVPAQAAPTAPTATVITIDTSADLDPSSLSKTCTFTAGPFVAASDGCTLRRAILEAAGRPQSDRPIEIKFNLPANDPNKDLEVAGTWTLQVNGTLPPLKTDTVLNTNGQVTMDGDTQPGGRALLPKVIIDTNDFSLSLESENNLIRNLSIKGGGVIFLKEDGNTVERVMMGLSDNGQSIFFREPGNERRMAGGGIFISSNNNIVRQNVIAGAFARAIDIDGGDNNLIEQNRIGTRADGSVPDVATTAQCLRSFSFDPQNWYGGWGIALSGSNNKVQQNRIAGLHILQSANDTPPMAIEIFGANHLIQDNVIGVDSGNKRVGVCGQGIKVSGSGTQILDNIVYGSRAGFESDESTAIFATDSSPLFGQILVRRNLVADGPGKVYSFGPLIPSALRLFDPARITKIDGATITGGATPGSACPGCLIDLYADDTDEIGEALAHLGSATADSNGAFSLTLSQPLTAGLGIRTSSTPLAAGIIGNFGAGSTSRVSKLYYPLSSVMVTGPLTGSVGISYTFTITVSPIGATAPLSYTIKTTDITTQTVSSESYVVKASYTWVAAGEKTINVSVKNELSEVLGSHKITLTSGSNGTGGTGMVYLPLVMN